MKRVSVIIVTYNSERDIFDCVRSLMSHADIPLEDVELIIVDNDSDDTESMFAGVRKIWGDDIVLIRNECNGGYGQGNNVGIRKATAPVLLIINPDVRFVGPFMEKPLGCFDKDNNLIMYGMKQMYSETQVSRNSFWFTTLINGYARTLLTGLCNRLDIYIPKYMYFSGSCFFVRKEMFEKVGLFDESVFMYGEEDDIHYRLMRRFGEGFRYDKHIRYIHLMLGRKPNVEYEKKLLEVDVYHHKKKGVSEKSTLTSYLQSNTVLLVRAYIRKVLGGGDSEQLTVLRQFRRHIKHRLSEL